MVKSAAKVVTNCNTMSTCAVLYYSTYFRNGLLTLASLLICVCLCVCKCEEMVSAAKADPRRFVRVAADSRDEAPLGVKLNARLG